MADQQQPAQVQTQAPAAQQPAKAQVQASPAKEPAKSNNDLAEYVLIGRDHDGFDKDGSRKRYVTGDRVTLSKKQFAAFRNKFKPVKEGDSEDAPVDPNK